MVDPYTGGAAAWVERFSAWEVRALLTPAAAPELDRVRGGAGAAGLPRRAGDPAGLEAVAGRHRRAGRGAHQPGVAADEGGPVPPMPAPLRREPRRWLDPTAPTPAEADRLMGDLRWYLKEDVDWLAACAVYPELRWDLTLELGRVLADGDGVRAG